MLSGRVVTLRLLERRDIRLIRGWRNLPEINRCFEGQDQIGELEQERWFEKLTLDKSCRFFLIERRGAPIGVCNLRAIHPVHRTASWGIYLTPNDHGHPFCAIDAAITLLDYAFDTLNLRKIYGDVFTTNTSAIGLNKAMGFVVVGTFHQHYFCQGEYIDTHLVELFPDRFRESTARIRSSLSGKQSSVP